MAATKQQGTYLGASLAGFTAFTAGLVAGGGLGITFAVIGAGALIYAAAGFYRVKGLQS